jgi:hypothetical protein
MARLLGMVLLLASAGCLGALGCGGAPFATSDAMGPGGTDAAGTDARGLWDALGVPALPGDGADTGEADAQALPSVLEADAPVLDASCKRICWSAYGTEYEWPCGECPQ